MTESLPEPSPEHPLYEKQLSVRSGATKLYFVTVNEGWRESIVCDGMYDWAADWLVDLIQGQPYAPERKIRHVEEP